MPAWLAMSGNALFVRWPVWFWSSVPHTNYWMHGCYRMIIIIVPYHDRLHFAQCGRKDSTEKCASSLARSATTNACVNLSVERLSIWNGALNSIAKEYWLERKQK